MSNLRHEVESETECHKHGPPQSGVLVLPDGHAPQTIYVTGFDQGHGRIPAFALQDHGPYFTEGFAWRSDKHPLPVTFVFTSDIAGIKSGHDELKCTKSCDGRQSISIPPATDTKVEYDFDVEFAGGHLHDPKIIVTPIAS